MKIQFFYYMSKAIKMKQIKRVAILILLIILLSVSLRIFIGEPCHISSASMEPTIKRGDWLWIDKVRYGAVLPRRWSDIPLLNIFTWIPSLRQKDQAINWGNHRFIGWTSPKVDDIVVFRSPENKEVLLVKRVFEWLPKGTFLCVNTENYNRYKSIFLQEGDTLIMRNGFFYNEDKLCNFYQLKNDFYYVLGDNKNISRDSRFFGYINKKNIIGKVKRVLFSTYKINRTLKSLQ